ncbi:MAG TPA: SPFH domain-containing protein [Phycisphaerales bacterium]|nr:SPFH domain-containing protein [Phycisphaerales bacterium]
MNRLVVIVLAAVVLLALVSYTSTFTVRYTEAAVLTSFGRATEADVKLEPGLYFKRPYPMQSVTKYDSRQRFLQTVSETQQTADSRQIIVEAFCTWRVSDPLRFFQKFSSAGERPEEHYRRAEEALRGLLRSSLGSVSQFRMDELFTAAPGGTKLPELEKKVMEQIVAKGPTGQGIAELGVTVVEVGINRVRLPEDTTKAVFEAMGQNRDRLAKDIEAKGEAVAAAIRAQAESDAQRIKAFAERRAQEIRAAGDFEAAAILKQMNTNQELAVFLKNMELIRDMVGGNRTTLVLPASMPGLNFLMPDAMNGVKSGQIPGSNFPKDWTGVTQQAKKVGESAGGDSAQEGGR